MYATSDRYAVVVVEVDPVLRDRVCSPRTATRDPGIGDPGYQTGFYRGPILDSSMQFKQSVDFSILLLNRLTHANNDCLWKSLPETVIELYRLHTREQPNVGNWVTGVVARSYSKMCGETPERIKQAKPESESVGPKSRAVAP